MIGQCLSNKNKNAAVSKSKNFLDLNKASIDPVQSKLMCGSADCSINPVLELHIVCGFSSKEAHNLILF